MSQYFPFAMSDMNAIDVVSIISGAAEAAACLGDEKSIKINGTRIAAPITARITIATRIQMRTLLRRFVCGSLILKEFEGKYHIQAR